MKNLTFLDPKSIGLIVIDCQEKIFPLVDHPNETLIGILKLIHGFRAIGLPIFFSEQYVKGLGKTIPQIVEAAGPTFVPEEKTRFSSARLENIAESPLKQWVLCGIEAHVCVLQTAKELTVAGKEVVVANDAISSRSIYDFSTGISEMKEWCRISSVETILFELIQDASSPHFKKCLELFKETPKHCACG